MKLQACLIVLLSAASVGCGLETRQTRVTAPPPAPINTGAAASDIVPSGTTLAIRVNEDISTREAGRTFDAQIAQDVVNQSGAILIPRGSPAQLVVTQVSKGGLVGTNTMQLALRSVTIHGNQRSVSTLIQEQRGNEGIGANRRTAESVGGGAALGALLGAVLGGGKGAVAGAAIGAAGGATAQVLTRGQEVKVPAETVLTFRLDQPIQLAG
ncbi:MAG: hypothetical protein IT165_20690 [Bryobacterales bacterium]|nr:hypothetical protein [Bryobacterales bacterium]